MEIAADLRDLFQSLSPPEREEAFARFEQLNAGGADYLRFAWREIFARKAEPNADGTWKGQLAPPGDYRVWLILAGRGYGKTRTSAEWVREEVDPHSATCKARGWSRGRFGLYAPTAADVRDVVVEGESGIMSISPPWFKPIYEPSKRRLTWPNGAIATTFGAEEPDRARGPQYDGLAADEIAAWEYPETFELAMLGLRLGPDPRACVTTTPRATPFIRRLAADKTTIITRGTTYDNRINLAVAFMQQIVAKYEGTRLGEQEIQGRILDDDENALWTATRLEATRVKLPPEMDRIVVAVDPSAGDKEGNDEQGIAAVGISRQAPDGNGGFTKDNKGLMHIYVLADRTIKSSPEGWASAAIDLALQLQADCIVGERNCGGDMVKATIDLVAEKRGVHVNVQDVVATRGKHVRAEPVAALWEQMRGHIVGRLSKMEREMVHFTAVGYIGGNDAGGPDPLPKSPNRSDAMIHAATKLLDGDYRLIAPAGKATQKGVGIEAWDIG